MRAAFSRSRASASRSPRSARARARRSRPRCRQAVAQLDPHHRVAHPAEGRAGLEGAGAREQHRELGRAQVADDVVAADAGVGGRPTVRPAWTRPCPGRAPCPRPRNGDGHPRAAPAGGGGTRSTVPRNPAASSTGRSLQPWSDAPGGDGGHGRRRRCRGPRRATPSVQVTVTLPSARSIVAIGPRSPSTRSAHLEGWPRARPRPRGSARRGQSSWMRRGSVTSCVIGCTAPGA